MKVYLAMRNESVSRLEDREIIEKVFLDKQIAEDWIDTEDPRCYIRELNTYDHWREKMKYYKTEVVFCITFDPKNKRVSVNDDDTWIKITPCVSNQGGGWGCSFIEKRLFYVVYSDKKYSNKKIKEAVIDYAKKNIQALIDTQNVNDVCRAMEIFRNAENEKIKA